GMVATTVLLAVSSTATLLLPALATYTRGGVGVGVTPGGRVAVGVAAGPVTAPLTAPSAPFWLLANTRSALCCRPTPAVVPRHPVPPPATAAGQRMTSKPFVVWRTTAAATLGASPVRSTVQFWLPMTTPVAVPDTPEPPTAPREKAQLCPTAVAQ